MKIYTIFRVNSAAIQAVNSKNLFIQLGRFPFAAIQAVVLHGIFHTWHTFPWNFPTGLTFSIAAIQAVIITLSLYNYQFCTAIHCCDKANNAWNFMSTTHCFSHK